MTAPTEEPCDVIVRALEQTNWNVSDEIRQRKADEIVKALDLDARDRAAEKRGADRALEANARAWQTKGWSDVLLPGMTNPIAQAQAVTDWLRAQAKGGDQ